MGLVLLFTFCIFNFAFAQSVLTAYGLAAFGTNAVTGGGGGGGGSDDLTGISLRYVADDVTGSDGTSISAWPDSGGNHFNATQANGGRQPVIKVNFVNGHRAVQFDGVSQVVTTNLSPTVIGTATATAIFIVLKQDSTQARNAVLSWEGTDVVTVYPTYDDVLYFYYKNNSTASVNGNQPTGWDNAWHVLECHRNGANMSILVDGTSVASRSTASGSFTQTGSANFNIGALSATGNVLFKGQIAEVRVYNQDKDSTSSGTIRTFLKTQYGTP